MKVVDMGTKKKKKLNCVLLHMKIDFTVNAIPHQTSVK